MRNPDQIRFRAIKLATSGAHETALPEFDQLIEVSGSSGDYAWRAQSLAAVGRYRDALNDCETAMTGDPSDPSAFATASFIRAASPVDELRDGTKALELITHALRLMDKPPNWRIRSIIAAAHAENGDFLAAEKFAAESLADAPSEMKERFLQRIQEYKNRIAYRATNENNILSLGVREYRCTVCGEPTVMFWPPRDPDRKPRCVDCCT